MPDNLEMLIREFVSKLDEISKHFEDVEKAMKGFPNLNPEQQEIMDRYDAKIQNLARILYQIYFEYTGDKRTLDQCNFDAEQRTHKLKSLNTSVDSGTVDDPFVGWVDHPKFEEPSGPVKFKFAHQILYLTKNRYLDAAASALGVLYGACTCPSEVIFSKKPVKLGESAKRLRSTLSCLAATRGINLDNPMQQAIQSSRDEMPTSAVGGPSAESTALAEKFWGKDQILDALKLPDDKWGLVQRYSKKFGGPIKVTAKGGSSFADKKALISWWNGIEDRMPQKRTEPLETYRHGKDGIVAPEISGSVKRRKQGQPRSPK